ncbi:hypothetical protein BRADI_3g21541v3 [Brachypodium distachyon]|uniref:VQ domain-containing protein n=1 Tax=Brachypodium distachyon TaxID=15368 RepID=A0A0Q3Q3H1_BRADI|nr:hypothetical protein BRADI_3g21541v3 [Brachypodium distachyon]
MDRHTTPQHGLTDEQQRRRRQGPPAPPRRSRTRRDPGEDHVHRVPPQDFARTVQTLTGLRGTSTQQQTPAPALSVSVSMSAGTSSAAPRSIGTQMQEAYLAWCDANAVLLSPGTMAEMDHAARFDSDNSRNNND